MNNKIPARITKFHSTTIILKLLQKRYTSARWQINKFQSLLWCTFFSVYTVQVEDEKAEKYYAQPQHVGKWNCTVLYYTVLYCFVF